MTKITPETYDRNILEQGQQKQIDDHYEPKAIARQRRISIIMRHLKLMPEMKVLDVGCGVGAFAFHCAKRDAFSVGIDYSKESVRMAVKLVESYCLQDKAVFSAADAFNMPFKDSVFDAVLAIDFIEHIHYDEKVRLLSEISRVLKDRGTVVIFTPNKIREAIGDLYWRLRHFLFGDKVPKDELHYGLISRQNFEKLLKKHGFLYEFYYYDLTRPYLAQLPFFRHFLSLNLLWIVHKL